MYIEEDDYWCVGFMFVDVDEDVFVVVWGEIFDGFGNQFDFVYCVEQVGGYGFYVVDILLGGDVYVVVGFVLVVGKGYQ